MSRFTTLAIASILLCQIAAQAQTERMRHSCMHNKSAALKTTIADPAEDDYDVKHVKLDLNVTNTSTTISGSATTTAIVMADSLANYVFELSSILTVDSVMVNGIMRTVAHSGDVHTVSITPAVRRDSAFTAVVYYGGTPTSGSIFSGAMGINSYASPRWGNNATFTLSQPYAAAEWWPCKQSLRDKIDSCDIWLTVPDSLKAGSNGLLMAVTTPRSGFARYEWKTRYMMDYYLLSLAVANYVEYNFYVPTAGGTDSIFVQNYVYNNPATLPFFKDDIDTTALMLTYFSSIFGDYPFRREKYGHCMAPLSGGMEHQTMSTMGFFDGGLIAHELGHQWFGDYVTCGSWADIFLNEGIASYTEYLFADRFRGRGAANADIRDRQADVTSRPGGAVYLRDTSSATIFDSRISYNKGACVLHMLRFVIGNDSSFFACMRNYLAQYADSTATIADFKRVTASVLGSTVNGMNLDTFFHQWVYQEGFPIYSISWKQTGSDVYIRINQTTSVPGSVSVFQTPVQVRLRSAAGDTLVTLFNNQAEQWYRLSWGKTALSLAFDPNYWLLYELNGITKDPTLAIDDLNALPISVWPNPTHTAWQVANVPPNTPILLCDMAGRVLWQTENGGGNATIPAANLAPGIYMLHLQQSGTTMVHKLLRD